MKRRDFIKTVGITAAGTVVFASTADVYGPWHEDAVTENTPPEPATAYAEAKLEAVHAGRGRLVGEKDQRIGFEREIRLPPARDRHLVHGDVRDPPRILDAGRPDLRSCSNRQPGHVAADESVRSEDDEPEPGEVTEPGREVGGSGRRLRVYQFRTGSLRPIADASRSTASEAT